MLGNSLRPVGSCLLFPPTNMFMFWGHSDHTTFHCKRQLQSDYTLRSVHSSVVCQSWGLHEAFSEEMPQALLLIQTDSAHSSGRSLFLPCPFRLQGAGGTVKCTGLHNHNELILPCPEWTNTARHVPKLMGEAVPPSRSPTDTGMAWCRLLMGLLLIPCARSDCEYMGKNVAPPRHIQGQ